MSAHVAERGLGRVPHPKASGFASDKSTRAWVMAFRIS